MASSPRIGIFWLFFKDGSIKIFHVIPVALEFGEEYGDFITPKELHHSEWQALKSSGFVPKTSEYEDLPRGRVGYNKLTGIYVVYHGKWLNQQAKSAIINEFKLPSKSRFENDLHYNHIKTWAL